MPSFAVRKVLQERYNADRRHIYDYFHSRGLRVVRKEKVNSGVETPVSQSPVGSTAPYMMVSKFFNILLVA
ncbi:hypothetical protein M404DRAFT_137806 [Pisolithus tinctorius Marx 270]|uniref:Uncharacterized protein n=1 Tax=Pisolithus tinctorius Marx 270 TaxID=870435 RepID=A0A0C3JCT7_PISTI|nr:hypothetical protein M404DRAFT_137806 [Pisolithus tinctorius Marx 270]